MSNKLILAGLLALAQAPAVLGATVDLGVSVHLGALNATGSYYAFDNIPYAEPPTGSRRFKAPSPKVSINRTINDGSVQRICPSANPAWFGISVPYMLSQLFGPLPPGPPPGPPPPVDPRETEDCLYLDVKAPKAVFDGPGIKPKNLPVLVWIHGGGFAGGSKDGNPAGLIKQGFRDGKKGFVFVAINYRLGLFGFPPKGPLDFDVATNAGLMDQQLALLWVKANIAKFGGDPNKITVFGESAGASSIAFLLTSYNGAPVPFKRALLQSPATRPATDQAVYAGVYNEVLAAAGVSSIAALRALPSSTLTDVNRAVIGAAGFDHFTLGPNVDGIFVPDQLPVLLRKGRVPKNVEVMVSYTSDEGLLFTDPRVQDNTAFKALFQQLMPSIPASKINQLATIVYPEDFSGAQGYTDQSSRLRLALAESIVQCNAFATHLAYKNASRAFIFDVFPKIHAEDVAYTFWNGESTDSFGIPINLPVALNLQKWVVDYAMVGAGPGSAANVIPVYTNAAKTLQVTDTGNSVIQPDWAANPRCRWWVEGLFAP
ncbi:carboxylesterase family protein-like protein [Rhypophila decipiens]